MDENIPSLRKKEILGFLARLKLIRRAPMFMRDGDFDLICLDQYCDVDLLTSEFKLSRLAAKKLIFYKNSHRMTQTHRRSLVRYYYNKLSTEKLIDLIPELCGE
ncbi:MAG: hypothetical protein CMO44_13045 [Verrucomicrobiales bacterium]|nr:hypothetical protein [Verrucomicrobiales bacterium]|tara:strand:- start:37216 stop:37527 length:312 start_codon:yes stop_codon:yes gene_type:complete